MYGKTNKCPKKTKPATKRPKTVAKKIKKFTSKKKY